MIEDLKAHWWWLSAIGAGIVGFATGLFSALRWVLGIQARVDALEKKQVADKEDLILKLAALEKDIKSEQRYQRERLEYLAEMGARSETKLDSVHTYIRVLSKGKE